MKHTRTHTFPAIGSEVTEELSKLLDLHGPARQPQQTWTESGRARLCPGQLVSVDQGGLCLVIPTIQN